MFGFINIYKPVGMTSHDVVSCLRRVTKIKQIGHTGTLDPFAEGVLPIAIGKATRLIEYLNDDKAYIGRFCFGKSTDTYDVEGTVITEYDTKVSEQDIITHLPQGEIEQYPPIYSAKKINGKKMYELARSGVSADDIDIKPCNVTIYKTELLEFNEEEQWADIYVACSKGTYIRSIANDLGKALNNGCYLSKLKRVEAGCATLENSIKLDDLQTVQEVEKVLINPIYLLPQPKQELNDIEYERISHGMTIFNRITAEIDDTVLLVRNNQLIAIAKADENGLKPQKVFI
ncbi:MAG: tRNA pseudouridine(55) synthase TruB [Cyanobacteria bacterium RUI128]|nr:tRNA pseudouridine(55) synthase TruB [Cyanobacteria bacterium RUI128]